MNLEIGMYVRTINGKIWVITSQKAISGHRKDIINASFNIIDLIEVGDYVNGVMVTEIKDGKPFKEDYNDPYYSYYFDDIYSIVTKEQFESIEYKVKD